MLVASLEPLIRHELEEGMKGKDVLTLQTGAHDSVHHESGTIRNTPIRIEKPSV